VIIILIIAGVSSFLNVSSFKSRIVSDSEALKLRLNNSSYIERLERLLASKPIAFKRGPVTINFNAVFSTVRAVFFMSFGSLAAEGAPFCS
jgi:hypothetical protein